MFGLIGQIAWAIENMEFNVFLFNEIGGNSTDIANMVSMSSIVATITTLIMGTVSDRIGHRKLFLCIGYILWGLSTMAFAFISRENVEMMVGAERALSTGVLMVILMDCVMTFFGSTANDASFNSWVTEITDSENRPKVEGVLNTFPLISMLIVAGGAGILINLTNWPTFFIIVGAVVVVCGILGLFFVKDVKSVQSEDSSFFRNLIYGFRPSVIKENKKFYIALLALSIFNIATNIFMPYLIIYLESTLGFDFLTYGIVMGVVILLASIVSVVFSSKIDSLGRDRVLTFAIIIFAFGLFMVSFMKTPVLFGVFGTIMMIGFVFISIILMSTIRDYTPLDHVGMFQGIRIIAYVMIPMIIGPYIGSFLIERFSKGTYTNSYNEVVKLPVSYIFIASAVVSLLIFIPKAMLKKVEAK